MAENIMANQLVEKQDQVGKLNMVVHFRSWGVQIMKKTILKHGWTNHLITHVHVRLWILVIIVVVICAIITWKIIIKTMNWKLLNVETKIAWKFKSVQFLKKYIYINQNYKISMIIFWSKFSYRIISQISLIIFITSFFLNATYVSLKISI